jgi:hypothetical protein
MHREYFEILQFLYNIFAEIIPELHALTDLADLRFVRPLNTRPKFGRLGTKNSTNAAIFYEVWRDFSYNIIIFNDIKLKKRQCCTLVFLKFMFFLPLDFVKSQYSYHSGD